MAPGDDRIRARYRVLARLLPAEFRAAAGPDLETAAVACLERERARFGRAGALVAWAAIAADIVRVAARLRLEPAAPAPFHRKRIEAFMDNLRMDLRYALRGLKRQPGFAALTVLTLALGIGANTAIFSVVNAVLLRPLPYPNADELEYVTTRFQGQGLDKFWLSIPEVLELAQHNQSFSSVGGYRVAEFNVDTTPPFRPTVGVLTAGFLPTLGVPPLLGRGFTEADSVPGAERVALLSWELWQSRFGGDAGVLGRTFRADTIPRTIVGVMPRGFDILDARVDVWVPAIIDPKTLPVSRGGHGWYVVARRKPGVTPQQARADLEAMQSHWQDFVPAGTGHIFQLDNPNPATQHTLRIDPLKETVIGDIGRALVVLQGAVAFVLLIACANLANLLLARTESRQREFAARTAFGASRARLFSQFVTEGIVLAAFGAAAGVGLAWLGLRALLDISPDAIPRSSEIGLDPAVLAFSLGLTVLTGLVFGLTPLATLGSRLLASLRDGARTTSTRTQKVVRGALVVAEVTLAVVLVAGAGLLIRSLGNLMSVDPGFHREQLATFRVVLPALSYDPTRRVEFFGRLEDSLRRVPGVSQVAAMNGLPPSRRLDANDTDFEHIPNATAGTQGSGLPVENVDYWQTVTQRYIETMGIPIVKGRGFEPGDATGAPVALVNEALVERFFKGVEPIGARVKPPFPPNLAWLTIVGVVKDVKQGGVGAPVGTEIYFLAEQAQRAVGFVPNDMNLALRTSLPIDQLSGPVLQAVRALDPALPVVKLQTMDDVFGASVSRPRFLTFLLGIFGGLALVLAAIGTYGVLSYLVSRRSQEIGIRMALGAGRHEVLAMVLRQGLTLTGAGLILGAAGAVAAGRLMRTMLFNVSPVDPATIATVTIVMGLVALAACAVPALRATRVDPLTTLRQ
ncbi:MAG TPA: ABC transporter permease [Vicinamibacterales bacterium]|nr:ABC transporter permease [Vicinamibacterales bacterium]